MTVFFVDTSALAKRYVVEAGSTWVQSWTEPAAGHIIVICDITPVEMFSLLIRRQNERTLTAESVARLQTDFLVHVENDYLVVELDSDLCVQARDLVHRHRIRALNAIQLASAIRGVQTLQESIHFVSADENLLRAAASEGFITDNPNQHPEQAE
ncbi:MAG: type II toxin-antitoxin system VapC family toxin [Chloroflexi bacterium]|nr:type II toxin-antitoxin system VapC family toxin [Chloroflexota bacterium]